MNENKLSYQGDMADGFSVYHMIIDGRPVLEVKASKDEAGIPIYVRQFGSPLDWTKTACRAFTVEDGSRISAMTMQASLYGNLMFILADLLVGPVQK